MAALFRSCCCWYELLERPSIAFRNISRSALDSSNAWASPDYLLPLPFLIALVPETCNSRGGKELQFHFLGKLLLLHKTFPFIIKKYYILSKVVKAFNKIKIILECNGFLAILKTSQHLAVGCKLLLFELHIKYHYGSTNWCSETSG